MRPHPVVAITGASAGIGLATALRLARDGASVIASARRGDRLDALVDEITAAKGQALAVVADVRHEEDMHRLVQRSVERFQRLDVMICNAGFGVEGSADDVSSEQMRKLMDINYLGTFLAARAALPIFRRQGTGHLIFVSSIVGKRGVPYMGAYSATKFAQVGLAECAARGADRIRHSRQRGVPGVDRHRVLRGDGEGGRHGVTRQRPAADRRGGRRRDRGGDRPPHPGGLPLQESARRWCC